MQNLPIFKSKQQKCGTISLTIQKLSQKITYKSLQETCIFADQRIVDTLGDEICKRSPMGLCVDAK